ncbi:neutral zinc metallopeptidase [Synechococcus elongatus]|uniref:neutral zinc metallopeptidase n=1 Tax=Synechococcus elongatus TaxID=32046 RepID=UPI0030CB3145
MLGRKWIALGGLIWVLGSALPAIAEWTPAAKNTVETKLVLLWRSVFRRLDREFKVPAFIDASGNWVAQKSARRYSPCGDVFLAHYCVRDGNIYFNENELSGIALELGDSAAFLALIHEYGHAIQHRLGLLKAERPLKAIELEADCFAGVQMAYLNDLDLLEPNDLDEVVTAYGLYGDYDITSSSHHGTPEERIQSFFKGFHKGMAACLAPSAAPVNPQQQTVSRRDCRLSLSVL